MMHLTTLAMLTVRGIPLPQPVIESNTIILLMLCCCFFSMVAFTKCRAMLAEEIKTFFLQHGRTRNSLFNLSTVTNRRLRALLIPEACILASVFAYFMLHAIHPEQTPDRPFLLWMLLCSVCCLLFIYVKRAMYAIIGWMFIDRDRVRAWMQAYNIVLRITSFLLPPVTLIVAFLDPRFTVMVHIGLLLVVLSKLLILFKWIKLFCDKPYGYFPISVYFCALEIIPLFYMVVGIMKLNEFVVFNF